MSPVGPVTRRQTPDEVVALANRILSITDNAGENEVLNYGKPHLRSTGRENVKVADDPLLKFLASLRVALCAQGRVPVRTSISWRH